MKNSLRIFVSVIALICIVSVLSSCGENKANTLSCDIYAAAEKVTTELDFSGAHILTDKDDEAEFMLMFQYGVEDEEALEAITGYVLTAPEANSAKTFAVITFKEGTDMTVIESVKQTVTDIYLANLIETTATYNVDEAKIADNATFKLYDNALVLAAYDTDGNTQVFDLIN